MFVLLCTKVALFVFALANILPGGVDDRQVN